jgi:hypothetical protein
MDATTLTPTHTGPTHGPPVDHGRLVELVVHLTDCHAERAVAAVNRAAALRDPRTHEEKLAVVAEALVALRRIDLRDARPA